MQRLAHVKPDFADHYWPCVDSDPRGQRNVARLQLRVERSESGDDLQSRAHGSASIVFMRGRMPKEHHRAIALKVCEMTIMPPDDRYTGGAVRFDDFAIVLGIERLGQ